MSVTCENSFLSLDKQLETLFRTDGTFNGLATEVAALNGNMIPAINCDNNNLTFADLLLLCFTVDSCGKPAIRITTIESCDLVKNCNNNDFKFMNSIFAYDTVAKKYYLVLSVPTP